MKRRIQTPSPTESLPFREEPIESRKRIKRPRTESYLLSKLVYKDVVHSCETFRVFLSKLIKNDDGCRDGSISANPRRMGIVKSTERNIRRYVQKYEEKCLRTCRELKNEAKQTIDLSNGFDSIAKAIDEKVHTPKGDNACILSMLNLGYETNAAIKVQIAEYAGVASSDQLDDMKTLALQLQRDGI